MPGLPTFCRFSVLLVLMLHCCEYPRTSFAQEDSALQTMIAMEKLLVDSIEKSQRSVVAIARVRKGSIGDPTDPDFVPNEFGTGVVIDRNGLILTNYHVLGKIEENDYYVWLNRRPFQVIKVMKADAVKAADPWTDLAVLQIRAADLEPITFGDGAKVRKGQIVVSLGNPYAIARDGQPSASWGIVSNLSRKATLNPTSTGEKEKASSIHEYGTMIQTDARLNLGTSGGALVNLKGEMIGLTTSIAAMQQYESAAGFAIPVNDMFHRVVNALKRGDQPEFGFLGIAPANLSLRARREGARGIRVDRVVEGSPAHIARVQIGDYITRINEFPIADSSDLMRELASQQVGAEVDLSIIRLGEGEMKIPVTLSKKLIDVDIPAYSTNPVKKWRGMSVDHYTAIRDFVEVKHLVDPIGCVVVTDVDHDSPAWKAGFRPRRFVSAVNGKRIKTPAEFHEQVEKAEKQNGKVRLQLSLGRGQSEIIFIDEKSESK